MATDANLNAQRDISIGGDVVGRDKITTITGYTVEQVSALLAQIGETFRPRPFEGRCPYRGLDAFDEDDAELFFGRENLVADLVSWVRDTRFLVIAGPSGSGKSSLVRAGLLHTLKKGALPGSDRWLYAILMPGRDPLEQLARAMSRMTKAPEVGDYFRRNIGDMDALHKSAEAVLSDRHDQRAVIVVDQFEGAFTQVSQESERTAFLTLLTRAATVEDGRVTMLLAMRSDFVSSCAAYPQLNNLLNRQFLQVGMMRLEELVRAIAQPALRVGLRIDPDLVTQIANDMQGEPGALPLMQFALQDLFNAQQAQGSLIALTLPGYLARGGLHKALARYADAEFARLSEAEQHVARAVFSGLVAIGREGQDTSRTAMLDELIPSGANRVSVEEVVRRLADARLITTGGHDQTRTVTIAHEKLIEAWPWLQRLVTEGRDRIALQNQIVEAAQEWERNARDSSYLYAGARLATVREQSIQKKLVLPELAQAFVLASSETQAAAERERETARQRELDRERQVAARLRTRNRIITGIAALAFGIALMAIFYWSLSNQNAAAANRNAETAQAANTEAADNLGAAQAAGTEAAMQRDEAVRQSRISLARQLAAQGQVVFEAEPLLGLRLVLEAWALVPSDGEDARGSILDPIRELAKGGRLLKLGDIEGVYPTSDGSIELLFKNYASREDYAAG